MQDIMRNICSVSNKHKSTYVLQTRSQEVDL